MRVAREARGLLEAQGILVVFPDPTDELEVDVAVEPAPDSPERLAYSACKVRARHWVRGVRDARLALSLAIAAPKGVFDELLIGVDPGTGGCGVTAIADGIVVWAGRGPCESLGERILWLKSWIPSKEYSVYVGSGPGFSVAEDSLASMGISYVVVEEYGTTRHPILWHVLEKLRDRDLVASASIALLGASSLGKRRLEELR